MKTQTTATLFKLDTELKKRLQKYCIDNEITMGKLLNNIILEYLKKNEK